MALNEMISKRFVDLETFFNQKVMPKNWRGNVDDATAEKWQEWATSVMNLFEGAFGADSVYARNMHEIYEESKNGWTYSLRKGMGIFEAAKSDYEGGFVVRFEKAISGEILSDFVLLAKATLNEGNKDVAAVLASAALEDTLKRYARENDLDVEGKDM